MGLVLKFVFLRKTNRGIERGSVKLLPMSWVCVPQTPNSFVLLGWETSASDSRILRDAVNRQNGLKVPIGMNSHIIIS